MAWIDYALEAKESKAFKGSDAITGLILRKTALARWLFYISICIIWIFNVFP